MNGAHEVMDAWFVVLHNLPDIQRATEYLSLMDHVTAKITDREAVQITATMCAMNHRNMIVLHVNEHSYSAARKDLNVIDQYLQSFPEDEDIHRAFIEGAEDIGFSLCFHKKFRQAEKLICQVENRYMTVQSLEYAEVLAVIYANLYVNLSEAVARCGLEDIASQEWKQASEKVALYKEKIAGLYDRYQKSRRVVSAYATMVSDDLMRQSLNGFRPIVTEAQYERFKGWYDTWNDCLEIGESFGRILFVMIDGLLNDPKKEFQVKSVLGELKKLADEMEPIYEKDESTNELRSYVQTIEWTMTAIGLRKKRNR